MRSWRINIVPRMGHAIALALLLFSIIGCAMLFPDRSAPKSGDYSFQPLEEPWKTIDVGENPSSIDALKADIAYENTQTGAIISLNSICRKYTSISLDELSNNLVIGIKSKQTLNEKYYDISNAKAKETTLEGEVENSKVKIKTVVLKVNDCTYDFILVSSPEKMELSEPYFSNFLASFKVE